MVVARALIGFLLLSALLPARALIGVQYQMQLGNPSGATADTNNHSHFLIQRAVQALDYNDSLGGPNWASWNLTASDIGSSGRSPSFYSDTNLPSNFVRLTTGDYSNSGFDRGHLCPSADRTDDATNNAVLFFMSNIMPQSPVNNQTVWANFETYCRSLAQSGNELLITCGPGGFNGSRIQPSGKAAIPGFTWKIAVIVTNGPGMATNRISENTRVITIKVPNNDSVSSSWQNYLTSPQQIQNDTGYTFFTALHPNIATVLRSKIDGQTNLPPGIDLAITSSHAGDFTQGDFNVFYTITVENLGNAPSMGTITVTHFLPEGIAVLAASGEGWNINLPNLSFSRSDALAGGTNFPPIILSVSVATNAPALVTNLVSVAGGGDENSGNNSGADETIIYPLDGAPVLLFGFDVSGQTNYGNNPLVPTTEAHNLEIAGFTRGIGVTTNTGTAAVRAWGGVNWTNASAASAIAANRFCSFSVSAADGYKISYSAISKFDYRRSGTGATNGVLQFRVGSGSFIDITNLVYSSSASGGGSIGAIDLSHFPALQSVTTNVTFRIVNWSGSGASGSWYIFDVSGDTNADFVIEGNVTAVAPPLSPIESWRQKWFGSTADNGAAADTNRLTGDGMPNLLKYALGLNPLSPTNNPVSGGINGGFLTLTVPRNSDATDITLSIEAKPFLDASPWTTNNVSIDQDTPSLLRAFYRDPIHMSPSAYMRLRVTRP